jgi:hypothetical protein
MSSSTSNLSPQQQKIQSIVSQIETSLNLLVSSSLIIAQNTNSDATEILTIIDNILHKIEKNINSALHIKNDTYSPPSVNTNTNTTA